MKISLAERGVIVSREAIRLWVNRFGSDASTEIARRTLESWLAANESASCDVSLARQVAAAHAGAPLTGLKGGREEVRREEIQARAMMDFLSFACVDRPRSTRAHSLAAIGQSLFLALGWVRLGR